ncbi:MAG: ABC transporter ATP-binding protein [Lentisphaeria bacterium]|nr:ABC transporter ATP-binding protein [Lentisphaeria bacterium]
MTTMLEINSLCRSFGGVKAAQNVSFHLDKDEILGLIGPNGAGKTTVFNLITGLDKSDQGTVTFQGTDITGHPAHKMVSHGLARTFQNIRLLGDMSVIDNVKIACHQQIDYNFIEGMLRLPRYFKTEKRVHQECLDLLTLFDLHDVAMENADALPYGKRRKLEIARAMATKPKLLLLDEPAAGMNPNETNDLMRMICRINDEFDMSILLIEHDMKLVMKICQRIVVMEHGIVIADGSPQDVRNNPKVIQAYLGTRHDKNNPDKE